MQGDPAIANVSTQQLASNAGARPWRTLLVGDSQQFLEVITAILELDGFVELVGTATNGVEAIEAAGTLYPDLVLMDVNMPTMNGLTATKFLSTHLPEITVLLMSGEEPPELRAACKASGAGGFIYKGRLRSELAVSLYELNM